MMPDDFPPFARGSDTSFDAAASMESIAGRLRKQVYTHVKQRRHLGATCDECEIALFMSHQTCSARINELHNRDWLFDSGERRPTRSGRMAVVWVTEKPMRKRKSFSEWIWGEH